EAGPCAGPAELPLVLPTHRPEDGRLLPADHVHQQLAHGPGGAGWPRVELLVGQRAAGLDELEVGPPVVSEDLAQGLVHAETVPPGAGNASSTRCPTSSRPGW